MKMSPSELPRRRPAPDSVDIELPLDAPQEVVGAADPAVPESDLVPLTPGRMPLPDIGSLMVEMGLIAKADVDRVLAFQQQHGMRFGQAAMQMKLVTKTDLARALSRQFAFPYLSSPPDAKTLSLELVTAYQPFSAAVAHLQAIRSQLLLRWFAPKEGRKVLAIVGTRRGEGRSYLASNLAILFAQLGERTLLIDADLRQPRQHELFMLQNRVGLSSLLAGRSGHDAIVPIEEIPGLFVLPAGPAPPNPLELLHRPNFDALLRDARANFSIVLIDTPCLAGGDDAVMVAARAGAALAVAGGSATRTADFNDMVQGLIDAGISVVGSVLNEGVRGMTRAE